MMNNTVIDPKMDSHLVAAKSGDKDQFSELAEPYRRELRIHCYRILGSLQDADDLVQETFVRAWRRLDTYQGRASFRAWLYKIATNACLDVLDQRHSRRLLPVDIYPASDPKATIDPPPQKSTGWSLFRMNGWSIKLPSIPKLGIPYMKVFHSPS